MRKLFNSKKFCRIIIAIILIYTIITCISQSQKLQSYNNQKNYYASQIEDLEEEKQDLEEEQKDYWQILTDYLEKSCGLK